MRYFVKSLALLSGLALALSPAMGAGNINLVIGDRSVDDDFQEVDNHNALGVTAFLKQDEWPIAIALGLYQSDDKASETFFDPSFGLVTLTVEGELTELSVGVAKVWDNFRHARPFIGGGVA